MKKRNMLKNLGVVMILAGAGGLCMQLLASIAAVMLATGSGTKLLIASLLMPALYSALLLAAGIFGIRFRAQDEKLSTCRMAGVLLLAMQAASLLYLLLTENFRRVHILTTLIGLILPILYLYAARQVMPDRRIHGEDSSTL